MFHLPEECEGYTISDPVIPTDCCWIRNQDNHQVAILRYKNGFFTIRRDDIGVIYNVRVEFFSDEEKLYHLKVGIQFLKSVLVELDARWLVFNTETFKSKIKEKRPLALHNEVIFKITKDKILRGCRDGYSDVECE